MSELSFSAVNGKHVSAAMTGGSNGIVVVHINFSGTGNKVTVEHTIDENNGWFKETTDVVGKVYEQTISGIATGQKVRIVANKSPESATYING